MARPLQPNHKSSLILAPSPPTNSHLPKPTFDLLSSLFIPPPPAAPPSPVKDAVASSTQLLPYAPQQPPRIRRRRRLLKQIDSSDDDEQENEVHQHIVDSQCTPSQPRGATPSTARMDVIVIDDSPKPSIAVGDKTSVSTTSAQQPEVVDLTGVVHENAMVPASSVQCAGHVRVRPTHYMPDAMPPGKDHNQTRPTNPFANGVVHRKKNTAACPIATTRPMQHRPTVEPGTSAFLQQCAALPSTTNRQQLLQELQLESSDDQCTSDNHDSDNDSDQASDGDAWPVHDTTQRDTQQHTTTQRDTRQQRGTRQCNNRQQKTRKTRDKQIQEEEEEDYWSSGDDSIQDEEEEEEDDAYEQAIPRHHAPSSSSSRKLHTSHHATSHHATPQQHGGVGMAALLRSTRAPGSTTTGSSTQGRVQRKAKGPSRMGPGREAGVGPPPTETWGEGMLYGQGAMEALSTPLTSQHINMDDVYTHNNNGGSARGVRNTGRRGQSSNNRRRKRARGGGVGGVAGAAPGGSSGGRGHWEKQGDVNTYIAADGTRLYGQTAYRAAMSDGNAKAKFKENNGRRRGRTGKRSGGGGGGGQKREGGGSSGGGGQRAGPSLMAEISAMDGF